MTTTRSVKSQRKTEASVVKFPRSAKIEVITPDVAKQMLKRNAWNRQMRRRHIDRIGRTLTESRWMFNGDTITFATDGRLLDGQHRLTACVETGVPFETVVVRGVEAEAFKTKDTGHRRNGADVLHISKVENSKEVASAVRWLTCLRSPNPMLRTSMIPDPDETLSVYKASPGIDYSVKIAKDVSAVIHSVGLSAALHYLFSQIDDEDADMFFADIKDGVGLQSGDPALVLRNTMTTIKGRLRGRGSVSNLHQAAIIIRAWNARRLKENCMILRGITKSRGGQYLFPQIETGTKQ